MSFNFALFGERRKKGTKGGFGRGAVTIGDIGVAKFHDKITKKQMTDVQIATSDLDKELRSYPDITEAGRMYWRDEMAGMEQIRYMNMKVLAAVLVYLNEIRGNLIPEAFTNQRLEPFFEKLFKAKARKTGEGEVIGKKETEVETRNKEEDRTMKVIRYKEMFLRYARAVLLYRAEFQERVEAMVPPMEQLTLEDENTDDEGY